MGNNKSKLQSVYESKLKKLNESSSEQKQSDDNTDNILQNRPSDILAIILSYSHRPEQIHIINLLFPQPIQQYDKELPSILDHLITIPYIEPKLINIFNNKYHRNVLQNQMVNPDKYISIYFNNITLIGTDDNLSYLQSDSNSVLCTFLLYLIRKAEVFNKKNALQSLPIDGFIDGFKSNIQTMKIDGSQIENKFRVDDSKLENIKYKNEYEFRHFNRIQNSEIFNNLSWKQFNIIYIRNVINNMLNYCGDKMPKDNFDNINYGNDDLESLNMLLAPQLFCELNGIGIFCTQSKHASFVGAAQPRKGYRKAKTTHITTEKYAHVCYFDWSQNNLSVLSMVNKESFQHIKDKANVGKKLANYYVDQFFHP